MEAKEKVSSGAKTAGSLSPYTSKQGIFKLRKLPYRLSACKPTIEAVTACPSALAASDKAVVDSGVREDSQSVNS